MTRRKNVDHFAVAAACRATPGQWLMVGEYGSRYSAESTARVIRSGQTTSGRGRAAYAPPGSFEARVEQADRGHGIEVRYVGARESMEPLKPRQRAKLSDLIGATKPAGDRLLESFAEAVRERREHEHPKWEDLFCMNLSSYMGERIAPVLRRLIDAEAEVERLQGLTGGDAPALTVYRSSWDSFHLGTYTREAEARKHCEDRARRDLPGATLDWIVDEEDGVAELAASFGEDERSTGYTVTALEIASTYDPEADE
ncbi:hypothetical protein AB0465_11495 [Streptomyces griseoviridis]|uniref:hypothetical protein n=1 Tax=Streptomyces griseoviridis TaxID=45398 RepID=UPI00344FE847